MNTGPQLATVVSHRLGQNAIARSWYLAVTFELDGNPDAEPERITGRIQFSDTEAGARVARKSLKAIGFDPDTGSIQQLDDDHELLAGKRCEIDIQEEEYNGRSELKVKWINPLPGPKDKSTIQKIDTLLRSVASEKSKAKGKGKPKTADDADDADAATREAADSI